MQFQAVCMRANNRLFRNFPLQCSIYRDFSNAEMPAAQYVQNLNFNLNMLASTPHKWNNALKFYPDYM